MNREIEFRAWHEGHKTMVYFDNKKIGNDVYQLRHLASLLNGERGDVLMQYTGLKDKNGVKIFECDVCKNDVYWDYPREIGLNYLNAVCSLDKDGSQYMFYMSTLDNIEIIGNIHQDQKAKTWTQK